MNLLKTHLTKVIIVLLLTLFITSGIIGISYYKFISDTRKYNEDINLNNVYYEYINKRDNNTLKLLKEKEYIKDVFYDDEYYEETKFEDGDYFTLYGISTSKLKIAKGRNLDLNSNNEIICPSHFAFTEEDVLNNKYIDIESYLNKKIKLTNSEEITKEYTLVGLIDNKNSIIEPTECFTTHSGVKELKVLYEDDSDTKRILVEIDNKNSLSKLQNDFPNLNFDKVIYPNNDINNIVYGISFAICLISLIISMIMIKFIKENTIKKVLNTIIISFLLGVSISYIFLSKIVSKVVPKIFLFYNDSINIPIIGVIVVIILLSTILFIYTLILNKKNNNKETIIKNDIFKYITEFLLLIGIIYVLNIVLFNYTANIFLLTIYTVITCISMYVMYYYLNKESKGNNKKMLISYVIIYMTILLLITGIFRNHNISLQNNKSINLIPFVETINNIVKGNTFNQIITLLGNIILFFPLTYLLPRIYDNNKLLKTILSIFSLSIILETVQLILGTGVVDIDDIIFNTLGSLAIYPLFNKTRLSKTVDKIILFEEEKLDKKDLLLTIIGTIVILSIVVFLMYCYWK